MKPQTLRRTCVALLLTVLCNPLAAKFVNNSVQVPVDRVVANVEKWIKEKPTDAQAYYVLGRIHAMAWAYGPELNLWKPMGASVVTDDPFSGQLPGFAPYDSVEVRIAVPKKELKLADARHLEASIKNYHKAAELDPKSAIYELGLAWVLQETGKVSAVLPVGVFPEVQEVKVTDEEKAAYASAMRAMASEDAEVRSRANKTLAEAMPKPYRQLQNNAVNDSRILERLDQVLKNYWDQLALEHFRKAYAIDLEKNLQGRVMGPGADTMVSYEAAEAILAILKEQPDLAKGDEVKELTANMQKMGGGGMVRTPVIFGMPGINTETGVKRLIDNDKRVTFDLAGDQVPRHWPWVKDGTAILVWDPAHTGTITNGKQLFGDRTWWIFFRNGYEALSVLDDNRDGQLTGAELQGIAVWIDKNGNGISEPGEVVSLETAGIMSIGVNAYADSDGTLVSTQGIRFSNGTVVKSFDWVTSPATDHPTAPQREVTR